MRIAFVQTYPIYHDSRSTECFLALQNRDRWMPGILASEGHEVEFWGVDRRSSCHVSSSDGFGDYPIRLFDHDRVRRPTKFHRSQALVEHARRFSPDLTILKGVDGGSGIHLLNKYLAPQSRPFAVVIGGTYYAPYLSNAVAVLYESNYQRDTLGRPGFRFWRRPVPSQRLLRLPKSVDTDRFCPDPAIEKEFDIVVVGRLIRRLKSFAALGRLATTYRVAVVGDGPDAETLRARYRRVAWLGRVDHDEMPKMLNRARALFHPGFRDYYPRVLAEAAACGLPSIAFAGAIMEDVLPASIGVRVSRNDYMKDVDLLFSDTEMLARMGESARRHAVEHSGKYSSRHTLEQLLLAMRDHYQQEAVA